ncbi:MAG: LytTR family transcriptional regulator DNA-binding domain-containing protein [Pseudomonadota bacterium]
MKYFYPKPIIRLLFLALLFVFYNTAINAKTIVPNIKIMICPSLSDSLNIPNFEQSSCYESYLSSINPQNKEIWIKLQIDVDSHYLKQTKPLALFIHGKASSLVYLNGHHIGNNGKPGSSKATEVVGVMDAVFFIDDKYIQKGLNQLVIKMSTQHGFIHLAHPINSIRLGIFHNPTHEILKHYWLSLLPFGAFILSAFFLGILSSKQSNKKSLVFLVLMSLIAACQLLIEISRGIWQYTYPFHDIRLVLILLFSFGFGMSLFAHIVYKFLTNRRMVLIVSVFFITLTSIFFAKGFDLKSTFGILVPSLSAFLICLMASIKRKPHALLMAIVLLVFSIIFLLDMSRFLDSYFYFVVAFLMLVLISQQAIEFIDEKNNRLLEKNRADQLQLIIDQKNEDINNLSIKVNATGKIQKITINKIAYCKGAGDYVELFLLDNSTILHNTTLKEMEKILPHTFLKVHRSYIVNTSQIKSLERITSGTGQLLLKNDLIVPVSRRIMPKVRQQLI